MSRKTLKILLCAFGAICVVLITFRSQINFYLLTGQFTPASIVETLQSPVQVTGWVADGLVLADGRKVSIPGLNELPTSSQALSEFTKRGVEISPDGRLTGLTRVHHWCGNDPVREHIVRIDLSDALVFLGVGVPSPPIRDELPLRRGKGRFSEYGWYINEFLDFRHSSEIAALTR